MMPNTPRYALFSLTTLTDGTRSLSYLGDVTLPGTKGVKVDVHQLDFQWDLSPKNFVTAQAGSLSGTMHSVETLQVNQVDAHGKVTALNVPISAFTRENMNYIGGSYGWNITDKSGKKIATLELTLN